jgi:hypothetical protein
MKKLDDVFPTVSEWYGLDIKQPLPIHRAYKNQLIAVILDNGKVRVYDGEHNMDELSDSYYTYERVESWEKDKKLTNIFKNNFPQVKEIRIADL